MHQNFHGDNTQDLAAVTANRMGEVQATDIGGDAQGKIDGGIPACHGVLKIGPEIKVAAHEAVPAQIVVCRNSRSGGIHKIDVRTADDGRHSLHLVVSSQECPWVTR